MINVFFNEEYGYRHWWWSYPGTLDELIEDWLTGYAPFIDLKITIGADGKRNYYRKPYKGTLTELPTHWDLDNPFGPGCPAMVGKLGSYTVYVPGKEPEEMTPVRMDDFFQAYGECGVDVPYLRIGDEFFPGGDHLLEDEQEEVKKFSWLDHTEDPPWYQAWAKRYKASYHCNSEYNHQQIRRFMRGELAPIDAEEVENHMMGCKQCLTLAQDIQKENRKKRSRPFES